MVRLLLDKGAETSVDFVWTKGVVALLRGVAEKEDLAAEVTALPASQGAGSTAERLNKSNREPSSGLDDGSLFDLFSQTPCDGGGRWRHEEDPKKRKVGTSAAGCFDQFGRSDSPQTILFGGGLETPGAPNTVKRALFSTPDTTRVPLSAPAAGNIGAAPMGSAAGQRRPTAVPAHRDNASRAIKTLRPPAPYPKNDGPSRLELQKSAQRVLRLAPAEDRRPELDPRKAMRAIKSDPRRAGGGERWESHSRVNSDKTLAHLAWKKGVVALILCQEPKAST
ncbi:hypothetical protein T484DRAFT_1783913 [Baffinella frigidus]|nr:hypothetical protein T484DRAFT_1783913 [Cryptophyta sp. CCMP2293]